MSLINDALKRAKQQAQPNAVPAPVPAMHADFAPRRSRAANDFLLHSLVVVILLLAALLLWQWFRGNGDVAVRAKTIPLTENVPTPSAAPHGGAPVIAATPAVLNASAIQTPLLANGLPVPPAPATPPPTYKLQSIFYRAKNPMAFINGKMLSIGDRIGEARLTAISKGSATIVTAKGETKVLELPE